ncbi:MAG: cation-translocating P-type ATPase [Chloroflexi bacterium]|nr:cation-translocating P-type ATPase [Chloroflexota bacterium]
MATGIEPVAPDTLQVRSITAGRARFAAREVQGDGCRAAAIEHYLSEREGVRAVAAYPATGSVVVWFDPRQIDAAAIRRAIVESADLPPPERHRRPAPAIHSGDVARLALGGILLGIVLLRRLLVGPWRPLVGPRLSGLAAVVALFTGYPFFRGALRALAGRQPIDTDALVTAATFASLVLRENIVALIVLWLLNIGEFLQDLTLRRTRRAIEELLAIGEDRVWLVVGGVEVQVPLAQLAAGDTVAVYAHHKIPADGEVVEGEGAVNQAPITGESLPVYRRAGETVYAGTILETGSFRVRATRVGMETVAGRIIQRVEEAQATRAPIQTLAERFSRRFVPFSFALAALVYLVTRDARRSMTMLLIACPCAAGLSTPTAISAAIGSAARQGILIKGGTFLEGAGRVDAVVFDKTGTLTIGRPLVTEVVALTEGSLPEEILALAASGEIHCRHPLAQAVVRHAEEREIEIPMHEECEVVIGMGVRADLQGNRILVGSARLLAEHGVEVDETARGWIERFAGRGETAICLGYNERLIGLLGVSDAIRPETVGLFDELRALGVRRILMLTGDIPEAAEVVARRLGLREYRARALPEEKLAAVRTLRAEGYLVAMVGDGTNDAPALALADVGIAMGATGSDVAIEAADIALAGNDLRQVAAVIHLGRHSLDVIRQNYALSIGVNSIGLVAGALGRLNPVLAAILHNLSSAAVVVNSARLIGYRSPPRATAGKNAYRYAGGVIRRTDSPPPPSPTA